MKAPFNPEEFALNINRRTFLGRAAYGLGGMALASLLNPQLTSSAQSVSDRKWKGVINPPHGQVKAKRVIHLCMAGGPSHLESFDYKPKLKEMDGKAFP